MTPDEQINDIYLAIYVEQESYPFWVDLTRDIKTDTLNVLVNLAALDAYLHSSDGLGDIRYWTAALYSYVVTGDIGANIDDVKSYTAPDDDGNSVGVIRVQTNKIPDILDGIGNIAVDVVEIAGGLATIETGVGAVGVAVGAINLVTDAIKLQTDIIQEDTDQIPFVQEDLSDLTAQVEDLQEDITELLQIIPEIEKLYEIQTDTDNDSFTYALDKIGNYDRPHLQLGMLGFKWITDYLAALMLTNAPPGEFELVNPEAIDGTNVLFLGKCFGIQILFDEVPDGYKVSPTEPYRYQTLGYISYGRLGGFHGYEPLIYANTVIQPLPSGCDSVRIELFPDLSASVSRIQPTTEE